MFSYSLVFVLIFAAVHNGNCLLNSSDKATVEKFKDLLGTKSNGLNKEERTFLKEFFQRTPDEILNNWVKTADGNIEKSSTLLLKSLQWRQKNDIENIEDWQAACGFNSGEYPHRVNGFTNEGYPVLYSQMGLWDARKAVFNGHRADFLKEYTRMIEGAYKAINLDSKKNETLGQWIAIFDLKGISIRQVTSIRTLGAIAEMMRIYENNYPLHAKHVFIINAPPFFTIIFQIIQNIISPRGLKDFQIFTNDRNQWYPVIEKVIHSNAMPEELL